MTDIEYLQNFIETTISHLEQVRINGVKKELSFMINCSELDDFNYVDIRNAEKFKPIFDELVGLNGPVVYWFEIASESDTRKVIEALTKYKAFEKAKATPALRPKINYDSRVLYVGKVKGIFWGRLIQHLGFFKVDATQGLQLFYWAKDLALELKVNVLLFDENMADIIPIFELAFAKRLQPLIGKHK